jgi:uncharacterized phiE125 gp8 family phage protein
VSLRLLTPPAADPVSIQAAKAHLRITHSEEDALIHTLIGAATQQIEQRTDRALIAQEWMYLLDRFPASGAPVVLPKAPLISVSAVEYLAPDSTWQTWATDQYRVIGAADPGEGLAADPTAAHGGVVPVEGVAYPSTAPGREAVRVTFLAGYGDDPASVPEGLRAAVQIVLADLYGHGRESRLYGVGAVAETHALEALVAPFRLFGR